MCKGQSSGAPQKHPSDCTKFVQCAHGTAYEKLCPGGLRFNPSIKSCDHAANVACQIGSFENLVLCGRMFVASIKVCFLIFLCVLCSILRPHVDLRINREIFHFFIKLTCRSSQGRLNNVTAKTAFRRHSKADFLFKNLKRNIHS